MSLHQFDLAQFPGLVEPGLERALQPEQHVPPLAGDGLYPVVLHAGRGLDPKVNVH